MYKEVRAKEIPCISFLKGTVSNLYVGPKLSWWDRRKLRKIECKHNIVYLPELFDRISKEKFSYNFPGIPYPESFSVDNFYNTIREYVGNGITAKSKCFVRYDGDDFVVFIGTEDLNLAISYLEQDGHKFNDLGDDSDIRFRAVFEEEKSSMASSADESRESDEFCVTVNDDIEFIDEQESSIRFSVRSDKDEEAKCSTMDSRASHLQRMLDLENLQSPFDLQPRKTHSRKPVPNSDAKFESEMSKAAAEVRQAIEALVMTGYPVEIIRSWLKETVKLSRIRITKQFKIFLPDYDKEIKMGPLPKTVFLFYLRHPEGVRFSYLQDHVKELMHIYGCVSVNDDPKKMSESISALTNPLSNSICEKCAAIKKAFMLQIKDDIAEKYYVTGMQGGAKGISLDRSLVEWECEL